MTEPLPSALVTGFAPFGGEPVNPSQLIARALNGLVIAGHRIVGATLPTEFAASLRTLEELIADHRPGLVIAIGQAGGRAEISLERVAVNLIDARIADNAGAQPVDTPVVENAPNAYFSTLPVKAMLARLQDAQIPTSLSHSAGTFVCNQVFFGLLHLLETRDRLARTESPRTRGGFIHVPYLPEQAARHDDAPSLPLTQMIEAVRLCLEAALTTTGDLHFAAGAIY